MKRQDAARGSMMRRTLVNIFVAATSLTVLAGSWLGVAHADESRRTREASRTDTATALSESLRPNSATQPVPPAPSPTSTPATSPTTTPTVPGTPSATAVAGASATPPRTGSSAGVTTVAPPAPGLVPAPAATPVATSTPVVTATPAATVAPTATATPRRIVRPSRAS